MSAARTCTELGVCQHRAQRCDGCEPPQQTPPGGYWFAPGVIEEPPASDNLSWLEIALLSVTASATVGVVAGVAWAWWKGML